MGLHAVPYWLIVCGRPSPEHCVKKTFRSKPHIVVTVHCLHYEMCAFYTVGDGCYGRPRGKDEGNPLLCVSLSK